MKRKNTAQICFQWVGWDSSGALTQGYLEAPTIIVAKAHLHKRKIRIKMIRKQRNIPFFSNRIKPNLLCSFSRQLSTLLEAGIPLVQALASLQQGQNHPALQTLLEALQKTIESGSSLAYAFRQHPRYFSPLTCHLIDAGEKSGALEMMLDKVARYQEKTETLKRQLKQALTYPLVVLVMAFLISMALLLVVIPQFDALFKSFGAELPWLTRLIVSCAGFLQTHGTFLLASFFLIVWGLWYLKEKVPFFSKMKDILLLHLPILGTLLKKASLARFSRSLAITLSAGLPLVDALTAVAGATGHPFFSQASLKIRDRIAKGDSLQHALSQFPLFPTMLTQMVRTGEESGNLESILNKMADFYEEEVDHLINSLSSLIEPFMMAILALIVGILMVAMYLPIFRLGTVM